MRILIVKISAFGDVIHALPILPMIKEMVPHAKIYWAVDSQFQELLTDNPYLEGMVPLPVRYWKKYFKIGDIGEVLRLIRFIRAKKIDLCLDIQGNLKSGIVSFLSGAKLRYGFDRESVREIPNILFTNRKVSPKEEDTHIFHRMARIVSAALGEAGDEHKLYPNLFFPVGMRDGIREKLGVDGGKVNIAVHHGTTWETKKFSREKWISIISALLNVYGDDGLRVHFTWGNPEEKKVASDIIDGVGSASSRALILTPALSIKELGAFFSLMDLVIGPDTGPTHLAAASGAKTLSFYRVTMGERNAPVGPSHRYVQADVDCTGCLKRECVDEEKCEGSITVFGLVEKARELLPS